MLSVPETDWTYFIAPSQQVKKPTNAIHHNYWTSLHESTLKDLKGYTLSQKWYKQDLRQRSLQWCPTHWSRQSDTICYRLCFSQMPCLQNQIHSTLQTIGNKRSKTNIKSINTQSAKYNASNKPLHQAGHIASRMNVHTIGHLSDKFLQVVGCTGTDSHMQINKITRNKNTQRHRHNSTVSEGSTYLREDAFLLSWPWY